MALIYVLLVAHFVGDFICQTDWMALNKSKDWRALGVHVLVYGVVLFLAVWAAVWMPGVRFFYFSWAVGFVAVNMAAHFVQDAITSRITSRLWFIAMIPRVTVVDDEWPLFARVLPGKRHWFFVAIGFDQLLHYVILFVTASWWLR